MPKGLRPAPPLPHGAGLTLPSPRGPQIPPPEQGSYEYNVITQADGRATGARYPLLDDLNRNFTIVTQELDAVGEPIHPHHAFGMTEPTLRIIRDNTVVSVYVDGMTQDEFLAATDLQLHPEVKGQYVMSKRLSRVFRPHYVTGAFAPGDVAIRYMDEADFGAFCTADAADGPKVWDGAAVVSREMLKRLMIPDDCPPAKAARLQRELAHTDRIEFTIMTERGQDKGHAMISDDLDVDFLLPRDTKGEITLEADQIWIGVDFVHGKDHMRIDIQSAINLHPFFTDAQYAEWLTDAGAVYIRAVESGDVAKAMARIDRFSTVDDVESYGTRAYFASGGHPMWFRHHTKSFMNQRLDQLEVGAMHKHRIEIPGGRYYVMPAAVGRAAGYDGMDVPRGEIRIDHTRGTAWVNDDDWLSLEDSPTGDGIGGILGGADHDDALWLHAFTDHDGRQKALAWRSPNQLGEYVVLHPTADSVLPGWETAAGDTITAPPGDSRTLPARIDARNVAYTRRIDHENAGVYTYDDALARAQANAGVLGMTCNTLMVAKAVYGDLPEGMPAPLEDIIDAQVKTGADTSHMRDWNTAYVEQLLESGTPIPQLLIGDRDEEIKSRLSVDWQNRDHPPPRPTPTTDHWLDHTVAAVREHAEHIRQQRDALIERATPPREVFDSVFEDREAITLGAEFNATYARTLQQTRGDYDRAREASETFLNRFDEQDQNRILRGAIYNTYMGADRDGHTRSDAAVWQKGRRDPETGRRERGIEHRTLRALRETGALDEIGETSQGVMAYPGATTTTPPVQTIGIQDVWLNWHKTVAQRRGDRVPTGSRREQMAGVPKAIRDTVKRQIDQFTRDRFRDKVLTVAQDDAGQLIAYSEHGNVFGTLQHAGDLTPGDRIQIHHSRATDGNLRATYTQLPTQENSA